jgi:hypothetical protein
MGLAFDFGLNNWVCFFNYYFFKEIDMLLVGLHKIGFDFDKI